MHAPRRRPRRERGDHEPGVKASEKTGQKKARPGSRADKVWRSFSVNEKVCFGKQKPKYSDAARINYPQKPQTSVSNISTIRFRTFPVAFSPSIHVAHAQRRLVDTFRHATLIADKSLFIKKNMRPGDHCRRHNGLLRISEGPGL